MALGDLVAQLLPAAVHVVGVHGMPALPEPLALAPVGLAALAEHGLHVGEARLVHPAHGDRHQSSSCGSTSLCQFARFIRDGCTRGGSPGILG